MRLTGVFFFVLTELMLAMTLSRYSNSQAHGEIQKESCGNVDSISVVPYRLVRQWRTDVQPMPVLFVSVKRGDIKRESIIALGCHVGEKYSSENALDLYILDNEHAAQIYSPAHEGNSGETERSLRAVYEFSREKDQQWLDWRSDADHPSKWTHIDLGKAPMARKR